MKTRQIEHDLSELLDPQRLADFDEALARSKGGLYRFAAWCMETGTLVVVDCENGRPRRAWAKPCSRAEAAALMNALEAEAQVQVRH